MMRQTRKIETEVESQVSCKPIIPFLLKEFRVSKFPSKNSFYQNGNDFPKISLKPGVSHFVRRNIGVAKFPSKNSFYQNGNDFPKISLKTWCSQKGL